MKRILFLTQGETEVASSRHRVFQFLPKLREAGFDTVVHPAVTRQETEKVFFGRTFGTQVQRVFRTFTRRVRDLHELGDYDYVFVQKPILPAPFFNIEQKIARQSKMIFDMDDAVYLKRPGGSVFTGLLSQSERIKAICKKSYKVVVANEHLAEFVRKSGADPVVIPTVVDVDSYRERSRVTKRDHKIPVIGWVGSPSTQHDLSLVMPALMDLHPKAPFVVRAIGGIPLSMPVRFPIEWKPWRLDHEVEDIAHLEIALAPLSNNPWNRGKSGLKIIQYWASGVPVIASPVGTYKDMIVDGENGLFASNTPEWVQAMLRVMKDPELCQKLIRNGLKTAEERYSLKSAFPKFLQLFQDSAGLEKKQETDAAAASRTTTPATPPAG
jgi:glycosyltransferase involved in cell wall biosynthesis